MIIGIRALIPSIVALVFAPIRFSTMPVTTSPKFSILPSASLRVIVTAPWRISLPSETLATSSIVTTVPATVFTGTCLISSKPASPLLNQPVPRITNCSCPRFMYQPPTLALLFSSAATISSWVN